MRWPILVFHICGGVVGVLAGAAAMSFRKGSRRHRVAGNVFFVAMLAMGFSAAYLGNVIGGLLACYLVATAWLTGRRREAGTNIFDLTGFLFALTVGVLIVVHGVRLVTFFLGQQQVFPKAWPGAAVWFFPALLPLAAMIFWLVRIRFAKMHNSKSAPSSEHFIQPLA